MSNTFYRAYEDRYRGARDLIKERLRAYEPFLAPLAGGTVLDLGCGRGEWLELLGELGFAARGVDLDEGMLAACRERGLDAVQGDALTALRATPDDSLAVVSAFHLVEHIPFDAVTTLIDEALRALRPGGLLIMETPNPENLVVGASTFYSDPSHLRPLPPTLLSFATEHGGFFRQHVLRLQEAPELRGTPAPALFDVLNGVSPDYSVVAQKSAPPDTLARFDEAFGARYGIDLHTLAQRYEETRHASHWQLGTQIGNLEQRVTTELNQLAAGFAHLNEAIAEGAAVTDRVAQRLQGAIDRAEERAVAVAADRESADIDRTALAMMVLRLEAAEQAMAATRLEVESRFADAQAQVRDMEQQLQEMRSTRSWRYTAPFRAWQKPSHGAAALPGGIPASGLSQAIWARARGLLRLIVRVTLRQPRMKQAVLQRLMRVPGLHSRIYHLMYRAEDVQSTKEATSSSENDATVDLSPRSMRIYNKVKQAQQSRMH